MSNKKDFNNEDFNNKDFIINLVKKECNIDKRSDNYLKELKKSVDLILLYEQWMSLEVIAVNKLVEKIIVKLSEKLDT